MSGIWNPTNFGITGSPVMGRSPPALRVIGPDLTADQRLAAQVVFARFCDAQRSSVVPNPTELGRLPDGTPYQIQVIGPQTYVTLWPRPGAPADTLRGVGLIARYGAEERLFVLTYINGWRIRSVQEFYGGSGVWVSASGRRYFTDNVPDKGFPGSAAARRYRPDVQDVSVHSGSTSVLGGLAYENDNNGVGMATLAGKYVQVAVSPLSLTMTTSISEAELVQEREFAVTPTAFYARPTPVATLEAAQPGGTDLVVRASLRGRGGHAKMRNGSGMVFALRAVNEPPVLGSATNGWLVNTALTHELQVRFLSGGGYETEVVPHAAIERILRVPDVDPPPPEDIVEPWRFSMAQTAWIGNSGNQVPGNGTLVDGDDSTTDIVTPVGVTGIVNDYTSSKTLERATKQRNPVYAGRAWNDSKVPMAVYVDAEATLTTTTEGESRYDLGVARASFVDETFDVLPLEAGAVVVSSDESSIPSDATIAQKFFPVVSSDPGILFGRRLLGHRSESFMELHSVARRTLETPWGDLLMVDEDTTTVTRHELREGSYFEGTPPEGVLYPSQQERELISISGAVTYKALLQVDPVLGVIAYIEFTADTFNVTAAEGGMFNAVSVDSSAKLVVLHRGAVVYEKVIPAGEIAEGLRATDGDNLRAGRLTQPSDPTVTSRPEVLLTVPESWRYVLASDPPDSPPHYLIGTTDYAYRQFDWLSLAASPAVRLINPSNVDAMVPLPGLADPDAYKVIVAIDPNSGGGVLMVSRLDDLLASWAISPGGTRTPLPGFIAARFGAPDEIKTFAISV